MSGAISLVPYGFMAHTATTSPAFIVPGTQHDTANAPKLLSVQPSVIYMNLKVPRMLNS
jgi:hypothetical protein